MVCPASAMLRPIFLLALLSVASALPHRNRRQADAYVDHLSGSGLPVILSAPHGGHLEPSNIPNRRTGCWEGDQCVYDHSCQNQDSRCSVTTVMDWNTQEITRALRDELCSLTGGLCPGAVINLLHRRKFDANRDKPEATFGVPVVEDAFDLYHEYIDAEKLQWEGDNALFIDMHGHGHPQVWAELGYLISGSNLNSGNFQAEDTSIRNLASKVQIPFENLLRGADSFGALLEGKGYVSVPSPTNPGPGSNSYFSGGYLTRRHGSRDGGTCDAIQIESARTHREDPNYPQALANVILDFLQAHHGWNYRK